MADLSGYTAVYVRTTGNDTTGDGSSGSPYATAQKAFEVAYDAGTGNYVIDLGVGSFGGVNLETATASSWPARIAVRGVSASESNLGGVNANGANQVVVEFSEVSAATAGHAVSIISNKSANLGSVSANGGSCDAELNSGEGANSGNVTLTDCKCGNVTADGGLGDSAGVGPCGSGGTVTISGCETGNVSASGGGQSGAGNAGSAGAISITSSVCTGSVSCNGGNGDNQTPGGSISLTDTVVSGAASSNGGNGNANNPAGGPVTLLRSSCASISANGGECYYPSSPASGGAVSLTDSTVSGAVESIGGFDYSNSMRFDGGAVTLAGSTQIPNSITCGSVTTTNLRKGRGVNGSSILGLT